MWGSQMSLAIPPFNMPKTTGYRPRDRASGSTSRNTATIETLAGKGPIMSALRHLASPIASSFSEAVRIDTEAGSWIFVAGQVGVAIPSDNKPISFEQEVRITFDRIRESLRKLDADMDKIASIKVYLTDLAPYAEFFKVRGEVFPNNPPTSTAVQVAGLFAWGTHRDRRRRVYRQGVRYS
jgi:2-iminobutanoate/2-iminopropanoate deaminase